MSEPTLDKFTILAQWEEYKRNLDWYKREESDLRKKVLAEFYPNHKEEGTESAELGDGWKLNAVFKQDYRFDKDKDFSFDIINGVAGKDLIDLFKKLNATEDGRAIVGELIKVSVTLSTTTYKKLTPSLKKIVNPYVTIKEASTTLKLIEPKEEK